MQPSSWMSPFQADLFPALPGALIHCYSLTPTLLTQSINSHIDIFISTIVNPDVSAAAIWESCKAYLRGEIISYSAYQRKIAMGKKVSLSKDIADLQSKCVDTPDADIFKELLTKKAECDILVSNAHHPDEHRYWNNH